MGCIHTTPIVPNDGIMFDDKVALFKVRDFLDKYGSSIMSQLHIEKYKEFSNIRIINPSIKYSHHIHNISDVCISNKLCFIFNHTLGHFDTTHRSHLNIIKKINKIFDIYMSKTHLNSRIILMNHKYTTRQLIKNEGLIDKIIKEMSSRDIRNLPVIDIKTESDLFSDTYLLEKEILGYTP